MSDSRSSLGFDMIQNMQEVDEELFGNGNPAETEVNAALEQGCRYFDDFLVNGVQIQDHIPELDVNIQISLAEMESGPVQPVDSLDPPAVSFGFEKIVPENLGDRL